MQIIEGIVVAHFGHSVMVETADGCHLYCHLRRNQAYPIVGDRVCCQRDQHEVGTVTHIATRRTLLQRGDKRGDGKPLAANLDLLLIVMNPPPILSEILVDRYTIAAALLKITPVLVVHKIDLLNSTQQAALAQQLAYYNEIGCEVILTSCMTPEGLQPLVHALKGKRGVLAGPSGVGKSSIVKLLTKTDTIQIGDVSPKGIGKHTTTVTRLYHLPEQGELIDSPGVRDFQLWSLNVTELFHGFTEMNRYATCRFRDCAHVAEPDCGVRSAVKAGKINAARYEHYVYLMNEIRSK